MEAIALEDGNHDTKLQNRHKTKITKKLTSERREGNIIENVSMK